MSKLTRTNAILQYPTSPDQEGSLQGYLVGMSNFNGALTKLSPDSTAAPLGVCVHYDSPGAPASVALMSGGLAGTVKVRLDGSASAGDYLIMGDSGVVLTDPGSGTRKQLGQALEDGIAEEHIEAILFHPLSLS